MQVINRDLFNPVNWQKGRVVKAQVSGIGNFQGIGACAAVEPQIVGRLDELAVSWSSPAPPL